MYGTLFCNSLISADHEQTTQNALYKCANVSNMLVSRGSSVSIVSGYKLEYRTIEVRSPTTEKDFSSSLCVQTGSGAHPASCTMGTGGSFPGKRDRGVMLTTHTHLVPRSRMSRIPLAQAPPWRVVGLFLSNMLNTTV
jgi:hypothetical protein